MEINKIKLFIIKNGLNIVNDGLAHKMYDTREVNADIILSNLPSYLD